MAKFETQSEAQRLLEQIQKYWSERGYNVSGVVEAAGYSPRLRSTVFEVRTDLVNGFPRVRAHA